MGRLHTYSIAFCTLVSTLVASPCFLVAAEGPATKNAVREITQVPGDPVDIRYADGRVARILRRERAHIFRAPMTLGENTCVKPSESAPPKVKCEFILPAVVQHYVAYWTTHPTRKGLQLEFSNGTPLLYGTQSFVTRTQSELFDTMIKRLPPSENTIGLKTSDRSLGRIECDHDLTGVMPSAPEILFWDENFEGGNAELAMARTQPGVRVNQNWRSYEGIRFEVSRKQPNVLRFDRFEYDYGLFTNYYPTGVSYKIIMTLRAPNYVDEDDQVCTVTWDMDFSRIFIATLAVLTYAGKGPFEPAKYKPFVFEDENPNPYARKWLEPKTWNEWVIQ